MEKLSFAAINQVVEKVPSLEEKELRGKEYKGWGEDNLAPQYLLDLSNSVPTLQAIERATTDYISGSSVECSFTLPDLEKGIINREGESIESLIKRLANDKCVFGGYAIQVVRNLGGQVCELKYVDVSECRVSENKVYLSQHWGKRAKAFVYDKYSEDKLNSILFEKGMTRGSYPVPVYNAALLECATEKEISKWHYNQIKNGFSGNCIISLNNGVPSDEDKDEIEHNLEEKFGGADNAGRMMLLFNDSKDNAATVEKLNDDKVDEKYLTLASHTKESIVTAWGIPPQLIGLSPEKTGFNSIEYKDALAIYLKTRVKPIQNEIVKSFEKIFGKDCLRINDYEVDC